MLPWSVTPVPNDFGNPKASSPKIPLSQLYIYAFSSSSRSIMIRPLPSPKSHSSAPKSQPSKPCPPYAKFLSKKAVNPVSRPNPSRCSHPSPPQLCSQEETPVPPSRTLVAIQTDKHQSVARVLLLVNEKLFVSYLPVGC